MNVIDIERHKYTELWQSVPEYHDHSPGLENVDRFIKIMRPKENASLIDLGCGEGIAGLRFDEFGLSVNWLDITDAGLSSLVPYRKFIKATLWSNWNHFNKYGYDYGFCCDVMEHIPTECTMLAADRIITACRLTWFQIALVPDSFGQFIDQQLHLTVRSFKWWLEHLHELGEVIEARDLCEHGLYIVKRK